MRISYIHGPGDAFGTFTRWREHRDDSRLIKQTYSGQFFDLVAELDGVGQIICVTRTEPTSDHRFQFETVRRKKASGIRYFLEELRYAKAVGKRIKKFNPDAIIVSSDFPSFAFDALPRRPIKILAMHNTFWWPYRKPSSVKFKILNFARKISLRHTNLAVCVSLECQRQFEQVRSNSSVLSILQIPHLTENFQEDRTDAPKKLLFVGRVEKDKGVEDIIHAIHLINSKFPDITLKIVGDGSALEELKRLVDRKDLGTVIEFTGRLGATDVGRAYSESDLCICPTHWSFNEGLATVPIEAASYGVPTIMSHAVPAKEYFGENSIVFSPGDSKDLASKIEAVISDSEAYKLAATDARETFVRTMSNVADWKSGILTCFRNETVNRFGAK